MNTKNPFYGLICPILTPFDSNGKLDSTATRKLVDHLIHQNLDGLMPCGTTGEGMLMTMEERKRLAEIVVEHTAGRANVIIHTGNITTANTIELSLHAREIGADGVSVITPYFYPYSEEALFRHYLAVAEAVPNFPISLYCFPNNANQNITPQLLRRLRSAAENIIAIKLSHNDLIQLQEYIDAGGDGFNTLNGVDAIALPARAAGACGQISGNSNVFPGPFLKMFAAFDRGDMVEARHQQAVINYIRSIFKDDLAYFKAAMTFQGVPVGSPRPPIMAVSGPELEELERKIRTSRLLTEITH